MMMKTRTVLFGVIGPLLPYVLIIIPAVGHFPMPETPERYKDKLDPILEKAIPAGTS